jgi:molybdopterin synthase sulfur carrier subunit
MPSIRLDSTLKEFVPRLTLASDMTSVRGVLSDIESQFPRLRLRLRDETGSLRKFVRVLVNGEDVNRLRGLETRLEPDDHLEILHSI